MRFYTTLKLGPNREMTREGFTLFRNVSVSRIGTQVYGPDEGTGVEPGPDGLIHITRTAEEVFRPETLDSGNGKSFVILHPEEDVAPANWRQLTHGVMFNMRRGTGEQSEESVCDLLVYTTEAVREIDLGTREVSLGYDADYYQTAPGHGEQRNIYINHVALVPSGRCGPSCAVRDHAHQSGECSMKSRWQRVLDAMRTKDEKEIEKAVSEARDAEETEAAEREAAEKASKDSKDEEFRKEVRDSITKLTDSIAELAKGKNESASADAAAEAERQKSEDEDTEEDIEEETGSEDAAKARDSALLEDTFENVKMVAEIIAPGVQIPTFDAKANPKKTFRDCVCGLRRKALNAATQDAETAEIITAVRGRALDAAAVAKMSCGEVRTLFNGVGAMKRNRNNSLLTVDSARPAVKTEDTGNPMAKFVAASKARWADNKK